MGEADAAGIEVRVQGHRLLFTTVAASLADVIVRTKSLLKGVMCSQASGFKLWEREECSERTLALPERTLTITIFF